MKLSELKRQMQDFNKKHEIKRKVDTKYLDNGDLICMRGRVVFKEKAFDPEFAPYTEEERTYVYDNYNKALTSDDLGYSIFAINETSSMDRIRIENAKDDAVEKAEIIEVVE